MKTKFTFLLPMLFVVNFSVLKAESGLKKAVKHHDYVLLKKRLSQNKYLLSDLYESFKIAYQDNNEIMMDLLIDSNYSDKNKSELLIELMIVVDDEKEFNELLQTRIINKKEREYLKNY